MTGPISVYAIAEMSRVADDYAREIRGELLRIGCSPGLLSVSNQAGRLLMSYQQQVIPIAPQQSLKVLRSVASGTPAADVWRTLLALEPAYGETGFRRLLNPVFIMAVCLFAVVVVVVIKLVVIATTG